MNAASSRRAPVLQVRAGGIHPCIDPEALDDLLLAAGGRTLSEASRERLRALHWQLVRRPVLFRSPTPGIFEVGDPDAPTLLRCDILAAAGAQLALTNRHRSDLVRASDFAAPDTVWADNSVRKGLGKFADVLEQANQRQLASAVRGIRVLGGFLVPPRRLSFDVV